MEVALRITNGPTMSDNNNIESKLRELYDSLKYAKNDTERRTIELRMQDMTVDIEQHPDWYDYGCECDLCNSYGEQ